MQRKLKLLSLLVIVFSMMCFAPTVFAAKEMFVGSGGTRIIAGTTGLGTENDPVVVDTYSELKQALEHNEVQYIILESADEVMPKVKNTSGKSMMALTAISVNGNKHLYLKGDAVFTSPPTGIINGVDDGYRSYGDFIGVNKGNSLHIDGTGSLKYKNCNIGEVNAVIENNGGTVVIHGGTLEGSFNTRAFCYSIN